jgi:hypothetical protein
VDASLARMARGTGARERTDRKSHDGPLLLLWVYVDLKIERRIVS